MAEFPYLPLFTDSLLADCNHLTDAEMGLYIRLLILIWRNTQCRIPNDPSWISRKLGRSPELIEPIIKEFCYSDGNHITQKRLLEEFQRAKTLSKRNSDNAKSMWNKKKDICQTYASSHDSGNAPIPIPILTNNNIEVINSNFHDRYRLRADLPDNWRQWVADKLQWPDDVVTDEWVRFGSYYRGKVGQTGLKTAAEWEAEWHSWCRGSKYKPNGENYGKNTKSSNKPGNGELARQAASRALDSLGIERQQ